MKEYINDIIPFHNIIIRNGYVHSSIFCVVFISTFFNKRELYDIYIWITVYICTANESIQIKEERKLHIGR